MKIEHAALYTEDLERMRSFFMKYFEASSNELYHNPKTGFTSYFLSFQEGARLEIMNKPQMEKTGDALVRTGFIHLAFSAGSKEKVDVLTETFRKDGYEILSGSRTTGDGYYESCILDPDGNRVEITE